MSRRLAAGLGIAAVALLAVVLGTAVYHTGLLHRVAPGWHVVLERVIGETPEHHLAAYLDAVNRRDKQAALDAWHLRGRPSPALEERRSSVTDGLLAEEITDYEIEQVEWWSTCCEPRPVDSPTYAGLARLRVTLNCADAPTRRYTFDVATREPYWGPIGGDPIRRWVLIDAYPDGEEPLAFRWPVS